jgi:hypothetical protein
MKNTISILFVLMDEFLPAHDIGVEAMSWASFRDALQPR